MTDTHDVIEDPTGQERLRTALREAQGNGISAKRMIDLAGAREHIKDRALNLFISGITAKISDSARRLLSEFWIHSPQGRFMRSNRSTRASLATKLAAILASGRLKSPDGFNVTGRYYVYYGSYMKKGHFVIRAMEVEFDDDVVVVRDHVIDRINEPVGGEHLRAEGVMTFEGRRPQILLWADIDENKRGLSLVLAEVPRYRDQLLKGFHGTLLVLNGDGKTVPRRCLFVREESDSLEEMIADTKIFPREELDDEKEKHRKSFVALANAHQFNLDPILWLCDWWPYKGDEFKQYA